MPVTMTWKRFKEEKPKHEQDVIWLRVRSDSGYYGYEPTEVTVEYQWEELDGLGEYTGCSTCYTEGDKQEANERLLILAAGWEMLDTDLWMCIEDYNTFLEENIQQLKSQKQDE